MLGFVLGSALLWNAKSQRPPKLLDSFSPDRISWKRMDQDQQKAHQKLQMAMALIDNARAAQHDGDLERAIKLYEDSLEILPTAEGYTYLAWALSLEGQLDEAIAYCHRAIEIDPEFGNPYNDIGSYLMQRDQLSDAIPWLERAKVAARYEPKHYPYMNLGKIYAARGELKRAIVEFRGAAANVPEGDDARGIVWGLEQAIDHLERKLN
jgi:tetratricopeptide (TPR) repeat protein